MRDLSRQDVLRLFRDWDGDVSESDEEISISSVNELHYQENRLVGDKIVWVPNAKKNVRCVVSVAFGYPNRPKLDAYEATYHIIGGILVTVEDEHEIEQTLNRFGFRRKGSKYIQLTLF